MPTKSIVYKITVINRILNFRRTLKVEAHNSLEARALALKSVPGFHEVETCIPVEYKPEQASSAACSRSM